MSVQGLPGLARDFIQCDSCPTYGKAWAHLTRHTPTSLFKEESLLLLLLFKLECGASASRELQGEGGFGD